MTNLRTVPLVIVAMVFSSCGEPDGRGNRMAGGVVEADGSFPVAYDSLRLAEDEQVFIALPRSLLVESDESEGDGYRVWVVDFTANTVLRFGASGEYLGRIGTPGPGPHEFQGAGHVFRGLSRIAPEVDLIGITDARTFDVKWFDVDDGSLVHRTRHTMGMVGHSKPLELGSWVGGDLLFPLMSMEHQSPLAAFDLDSDTWTHVGRLPEPYRRSLESGYGGFAVFFSRIYLATLDSTTAILGYTGMPELEIVDLRSGEQRRWGRVPERFRKGQPADLWRRFDVPDEFGEGFPFDWASANVGMWRLTDGRIVMVHIDDEYEGAPPRIELNSTAFLTVLFPDRDTACVDLGLPIGAEFRPVFDLYEDALFGLDRRLAEGLESNIWLYRFPIPTWDDCPSVHRMEGWLEAPDPG
jgi:hypothetical protein